jgi:hypothetical protein
MSVCACACPRAMHVQRTLCLSEFVRALVGSRMFVCVSVCRPPAAFDHAALALGSVRRCLSYAHAACCMRQGAAPSRTGPSDGCEGGLFRAASSCTCTGIGPQSLACCFESSSVQKGESIGMLELWYRLTEARRIRVPSLYSQCGPAPKRYTGVPRAQLIRCAMP